MRSIIAFALCVCFVFSSFAQNNHVLYELKGNWSFSFIGSATYYKAKVPGTVHTDLMENKLIPDPFIGMNEFQVQWVSQKDWIYKTNFKVGDSTLSKEAIELIFHGLDTYADVYLNHQLILKADNMFRVWKVDVKKILKPDNRLEIIFYSAEKRVDSLANQEKPLVRPCENNRHYARKAQYHFGWDWAPKLITCGIWKPIQLNAYNGLNPLTKLSEQATNSVVLKQEKDSIGESFYFTVDGKPTYMKGANWVPADVFLPRITRDRYRNLLVAAKEAGFNMLRVWGGGIYESDDFYELCDSLNIYVWQDFMFAGAMYPADEKFIKNVKEEIRDNVLRLRKYKCIVLWCGNNEIKEGWHHWGWQKQFNISRSDSTKIYNDYVRLFEEIIPEELKKYDQRPYIPTSPLYFGYGNPESMNYGDSHNWWVWVMHKPIDYYEKTVPRFASEFGMQAMPNWESLKLFIAPESLSYKIPKDLVIRNKELRVHQKHITGYENIAKYLKQNKYKPTHLKEYVAATQDIQSKALETALKAQIYSNKRCMGSLFWQFNDCWPVTSWSVVDYYGNKKKAYYTIKDIYTSE